MQRTSVACDANWETDHLATVGGGPGGSVLVAWELSVKLTYYVCCFIPSKTTATPITCIPSYTVLSPLKLDTSEKLTFPFSSVALTPRTLHSL